MHSIHQKILATALATIIITAVYIVNAQLTNTTTIHNTGQISVTKIWARSGTAEDIQAAVDAVAAVGGGLVYVPAGNFSFVINSSKLDPVRSLPTGVVIPGGVSVIGMGPDKTILYQPSEPPSSSTMFYLDGRNGKPIRISGIKFKGYVRSEDYATTAIRVGAVRNFRIDHCDFEDFSCTAISSFISYAGFKYPHKGVIDHCNFDNPYKDRIGGYWGYGIIVLGGDGIWVQNISDILGKYDEINNVVYIEDCTFSRCRHSIASNSEGYYVVRNCLFTEPRPRQYPMVDVHGGGPNQQGGRGLEAYNNTFIGVDYGDGRWLSCAFGLRGGSGVIFNNTIIDCQYCIGLGYDIGQLPYCAIHDLWIWNNKMIKRNAPQEGKLINNQGNFTEGEDYFLRAPNPEQDGFAYTPYPYPHTIIQSQT